MTPSFSRADLDAALESVSPAVKQAFQLSSAALTAAGVPHVVIGGLAVNAHGHHYSTKDVDYLVEAEDAFEGTLVLHHKRGVPFAVDGVAIDYLTVNAKWPIKVQEAAHNAISAARTINAPTVIQDWLLVWMKLSIGRSKDIAAVVGLVQAGLDVISVRKQLMVVGPPRVVDRFDQCISEADAT